MFSNRDPLCLLPSSPSKMAYKPKTVTSLSYFSRTFFYHCVLLLCFRQFIGPQTAEQTKGFLLWVHGEQTCWAFHLLITPLPSQGKFTIQRNSQHPGTSHMRNYNLPFTWEQNLKLNEQTCLACMHHPPLPGNLLANTCLAHYVAYAELLLQWGRPGRLSQLPKMFLPLPAFIYFFQSICRHVTLIFPWSRVPELCEVRHTSSHCCGPSMKKQNTAGSQYYQMSQSSQHNVTFPYLILTVYLKKKKLSLKVGRVLSFFAFLYYGVCMYVYWHTIWVPLSTEAKRGHYAL